MKTLKLLLSIFYLPAYIFGFIFYFILEGIRDGKYDAEDFYEDRNLPPANIYMRNKP